MTALQQPQPAAALPSGWPPGRLAACRDRKRRGYRCATVEVSAADIDALVSVGLLTEGERNHRTALVRKVSKWLWTEGCGFLYLGKQTVIRTGKLNAVRKGAVR